MANKNFKVKNSITIPEPLALTEGGTGQTSAGNALNALLPVQSSAANKFLQSDGTNVSWIANVAYQRGGTGSRPGSPSVGDLYYNTDTNIFEQYTSLGWFAIAAAPGIPTGATATNQPSGRAFNNGQMSVAFTPNTSGGAASSFIVTPTPTTSPTTFTGSSSPITITGLASSTQYTYTVAATSPYGTSSASSASSGVTATTVPQAPTIGTPTGGNAQVSVAFTPGATGGSTITGYTVTSSPGNITGTGSSSPIVVTGLTNGTAYTFTVTATNANGTSAASLASASITPTAFTLTGSYDALASYTVPSGGVSSIEFAGLPTGGQYTHLQIRGIWRQSDNDSTSYINMTFNSDTGNNYASHALSGNGSTASAQSYTSIPQIYVQTIASAFHGSNVFGALVLDVLDYTSNTKNKTTRALAGVDNNGSGILRLNSGLWMNTNPINSIRFTPSGGTINQHTQISVYGIRG